MPTLPTLGITEKLRLLYCQNSITISEQDYSVADTQEYFLLTKIYSIWCSLFRVVTASKRSLLRLRFYICLSVILFMGGSASRGSASEGSASRGSDLGGSASIEFCIQMGLHWRVGAWCRPPQSDTTGHGQRILLDCNLVCKVIFRRPAPSPRDVLN